MEGYYDGFSEREWRDYADDKWSVLPPPVPTWLWDHKDWMAYIYGPRPTEQAQPFSQSLSAAHD